MSSQPVHVYKGQALADYGFGDQHPFGADRHDVFHTALQGTPLMERVRLAKPETASPGQIALFHTDDYIRHVERMSAIGEGFLDQGDTPAVPGIFEKAQIVVGTTLAATDAIMQGDARRAFQPIGGLHHASRIAAAGFCVFNDCGVAIEHLRHRYGIRRIAYVDIDAHHGDGVYFGFEDDPDLIFADIHEDGRFLYPGSGAACEKGRGEAVGSKLNLPLPPGADDETFFDAWQRVEEFIAASEPEFIILQCGADSLDGDPLTHLRYSYKAHHKAASRLCGIANEYADGRLLATGGGGYNLDNIAKAWVAVVTALVETP
ncbi:MAG: acetoin utilization protein AcuC [Woeseia sp.]|nr:acetoin utilization protein AcuC [Woeseia sp.]MBT8095520.1 acetoin utilization protein AcuC [Woeseia sp.]NNE59872.1 acetoin utilization protein AcuC [Woeseia sp.]NNL55845.1 acetoin utilization protein AcuC [Woeseia sp.]